MNHKDLKYTRGVVIVHGKSELHLVKYIKTNLRLPVIIEAEKGGNSSIQINGLTKYLQKKQFKTLKAFSEYYSVEFDRKTKSLKNFRLFIIMDTDDCDENTKKQYISGEMFKNHLLAPYIVPIFNINNLEDVMMQAQIMPKRITNKEKGTYYAKIFPINTSPLSTDTICQVITFADRIRKLQTTNMTEMIDYCLSIVRQLNR